MLQFLSNLFQCYKNGILALQKQKKSHHHDATFHVIIPKTIFYFLFLLVHQGDSLGLDH